MKRLAIAVALVGGGVVLVRGLAPKLHARMMAACNGMFEQMPDDFPPKRMMSGIEEIRANTARTQALLEKFNRADEAGALVEPSTTRADKRESVPA